MARGDRKFREVIPFLQISPRKEVFGLFTRSLSAQVWICEIVDMLR
jgi:hypothetical protein